MHWRRAAPHPHLSEDGLHGAAQRQARHHGVQSRRQLAERLHRLRCLGGQPQLLAVGQRRQRGRRRRRRRLHAACGRARRRRCRRAGRGGGVAKEQGAQGEAALRGRRLQPLHRGVADGALRDVDDAGLGSSGRQPEVAGVGRAHSDRPAARCAGPAAGPLRRAPPSAHQRHVVPQAHRQAQVCHAVLHLHPPPEGHAADEDVRDAALHLRGHDKAGREVRGGGNRAGWACGLHGQGQVSWLHLGWRQCRRAPAPAPPRPLTSSCSSSRACACVRNSTAIWSWGCAPLRRGRAGVFGRHSPRA